MFFAAVCCLVLALGFASCSSGKITDTVSVAGGRIQEFTDAEKQVLLTHYPR